MVPQHWIKPGFYIIQGYLLHLVPEWTTPVYDMMPVSSRSHFGSFNSIDLVST